MKGCFAGSDSGKRSNNPIRSLIERDIPQYESWFKSFRALRNDFKMGRGHGLADQDGQIRIGIDLQQGSTSARVATIGLLEVIEGLEMSACLFRIMKKLARSKLGTR